MTSLRYPRFQAACSLVAVAILWLAPAAAAGRATTDPIALVAADARPDATSAPEAGPHQPPSIVILMLDDIGAHDGRLWEYLPAIRDRFIERGIAFTDFHGETPTCCPGRVGFLTGLHTDAHGVVRNNGTLFEPGMSLATQLRGRGYFTILAGKYLNAYESVVPKVPPGWSEFHAFGGGYYDYAMWSNGRYEWHGRRVRDYSTDVIRRKLLSALDRAPLGRPLFVWAAPYASHTPNLTARRHAHDRRCSGIPRWAPPGYMEADLSDKPAYVRGRRRGSVRGLSFERVCRPLLAVDDLLRAVTAKLRRQGRLEDTLFILTADNGMNYGMHRMKRDKKTPYATQLPFYVSWPSRLGTGRVPVDERLQNIDLAPTLCELAGCRLGPYPTGQRRPDGRSFADLLLGTGPGPRRGAVLASFRTEGAKVPRWYGVETTRYSPLAGRSCSLAGSNGCRWSYVRYETGEVELYDISNGPCWKWREGEPGDPCRLQNLARQPELADVKAELRRELARLRQQ